MAARCGTGDISLDMNGQDEYPYSPNRWLPWLLERGLCDPLTAAEYSGRKLLSPETFARLAVGALAYGRLAPTATARWRRNPMELIER